MKKIIALLVFIVVLTLSVSPAFAFDDYNYVLDADGRRVPIATAYTTEKVQIFFGNQVGPLKMPQDMFVDKQDNIYIVDTGNNRVLKFDKDWNFVLAITQAEGIPLNNPNGIYVDDDQDMYIADTSNNRIIHLTATGEFVEKFVEPENDASWNKNYEFRPLKVYIDPIGQIYMINMEDYHGFAILDAFNAFKGYIAPTRVPSSFWDKIIYFIASPEQKQKLGQVMPPVHSNMVIDDLGTIYTTTYRTNTTQFKRFSNIGVNIFPNAGPFGETRGDYSLIRYGKTVIEPKFTDVAVDKNGIVNLLDNTSGRIYQYDKDGMLLAVFGGTGRYAGKFIDAVSMTINSKGEIYILDANSGSIHMFKPTSFIKKIHSALQLYYNGEYEEAIGPWQEILGIDSSYIVAHIGMGKAYLKQENWKAAMDEYKSADNKAGYSEAFKGLRKEFTRKYFGFIVLAIGAFILLTIKSVQLLKKKQKSMPLV